MKLSRTAWIVLGTGILVIVMAGLGVVYSQQSSEQKRLNDSLAVAQSTFPGLVTEKTSWEEQVADLQSELSRSESDLVWAQTLLNSARTSFPTTVESIEYDEILFQFARDWQLELTGLTASEPVNTTVEDINYSTTTFSVAVAGKPGKATVKNAADYKQLYREYTYQAVGNILSYINAIATGTDFTTTTISSVEITVPGPLPLTDADIAEMIAALNEDLPEGDAEIVEVELEEFEKPTASLDLVIYSYEGE